MQISSEGLETLKKFEGFRSHAYSDVAGYKTIGYGHRLREGESFPEGISYVQAENLLRLDITYAEKAVSELVKAPIGPHQYDALVDFAYNLGIHTLAKSSLLAQINAEEFAQVPAEILSYDHAREDGELVVVEGLESRRKAEVALWNLDAPEASENAQKAA